MRPAIPLEIGVGHLEHVISIKILFMDNSSIRVPLLLIGIFFLTIFILGYLFLTNSETDEMPDEPIQEPIGIVDDQQQQQVVPISGVLTKTGSGWPTRDFLGDNDVKLVDEGALTYLIAEEKGPDGFIYQIFYFKDHSITISLLNEDLDFARSSAEIVLKKKLGLTDMEMCALAINVTTPRFVSNEYAGRLLGLSFCPNSVAF